LSCRGLRCWCCWLGGLCVAPRSPDAAEVRAAGLGSPLSRLLTSLVGVPALCGACCVVVLLRRIASYLCLDGWLSAAEVSADGVAWTCRDSCRRVGLELRRFVPLSGGARREEGRRDAVVALFVEASVGALEGCVVPLSRRVASCRCFDGWLGAAEVRAGASKGWRRVVALMADRAVEP
jgi:hypothetical protein